MQGYVFKLALILHFLELRKHHFQEINSIYKVNRVANATF